MENYDMTNSLGGLEREPTLQDVMLGSFTSVSTRPAVYMPEYKGIIENQQKTPSCGAHAGQSLKQILENWFRGSPEYLWKKIKLIDGLPPESGTNMLYIMKVLQKTGITSFNLLPNNAGVSVDAYTDPSILTQDMDNDAIQHLVGTYAFSFSPSTEEIKQAIYDHKAVILLVRIGAEWWTRKDGANSWKEFDILPLRSTAPIVSGHFVTAFAYDEKYIYFANEWTDQWGRGGIGYFSDDYISRVVELGTTIDASAVSFNLTRVLRLGCKGIDVRMLQTKLNEKNGCSLGLDGVFGSQTLKQVILYQTNNKLVPDGVVGPLTWKSLNPIKVVN